MDITLIIFSNDFYSNYFLVVDKSISEKFMLRAYICATLTVFKLCFDEMHFPIIQDKILQINLCTCKL